MPIKYLKIISVFILFLFVEINAQECKAHIVINVNKDAEIIIDTMKYYGQNIEVDLDKGNYNIKIRNRRIWNGQEINDTIKIYDCTAKLNLNYNLSERVKIDSSPQDAEIYSDSSLIGFTPKVIEKERLNTLILKKYGQLNKIDLANTSNTINFEIPQQTNGKLFGDSGLFKILIGSAVALGVTTAYFKLKADRKYDDYQISKDKALLDEVDRLDLISGVSLGLLQVNFGYLIYRFLFD